MDPAAFEPPTFTMQSVPGRPGVVQSVLNGPLDFEIPGSDAEAMLAEMRALEAANSQAEKTLAAEGVKLELVSLLRVRLEELTEHLLGPLEVDDRSNAGRVQFELRMQQRFARELAGVVGQVARAKLTAPGTTVPKSGSALIVPGA